MPWIVLAAVFFLTEAKVVHLHIGRSAHSFSMSEIPVVYGVFFFAPAEYIVARLLGAGLALVLSRRQRSVKLGFNLAQFLLCSVVTVGVVQIFVGTTPHSGRAIGRPPCWRPPPRTWWASSRWRLRSRSPRAPPSTPGSPGCC